MRYLKFICRTVWVYFLAWFLFMWLCSPVVALHYSATATETIGFFLDTESSITKRDLSPGESAFIPTAMNPPSDMWVTLSFPVASRDVLHFTEPFSRMDVYIGLGARIERTEIRHAFFARFSAPALP
ncbi:hypothetical protein [Achromobacter sp. NFACC18-2]|uniref:hypothetical protein n=1 Tax=Achromobacter sp. NFACC18-2 TaxID=1564112 RepID=UPI0008B613AA|nr:hypothetical protein [Achromobacter sp. NFACC18-2]SEJ51581.1 hypothetical protein SAMN03159494_02556 [Achromobacter sp. NFACC18-2]